MVAFTVSHYGRNTSASLSIIGVAEALAVAFSLVDNLEAVITVPNECPLIGILDEAHCVGVLCLVCSVTILDCACHIPCAAHCHIVPVSGSEVCGNLEGTSPCGGELNGSLLLADGDIYIIIGVERTLEVSRQGSDLCTILCWLRLGGIEGVASLVLHDVCNEV